MQYFFIASFYGNITCLTDKLPSHIYFIQAFYKSLLLNNKNLIGIAVIFDRAIILSSDMT